MDRNPLDDVELPGNNASPLDSVVVPDGYEPPSSFRKALTNVGGSTLSGVGRALKDIGLDSVGDAALRKGGEIQLDTQPTVQSFSDIANHPGDYVAESAGQMAGQVGLALAGETIGGAIGAGLGSLAGPLALVAVPALSAAGSYVGGNLPMLAQEYGSEREQQQQKGIDDKGRALAGAAATTAIENLGGFKPGGMVGAGKQIVSDLAGKGVKEGAKILGKKAIKAGLQEAAEEIPQQYTGAYGGGTDVENLNTPENAEQAAFGAAMALPGGTLFGAGNALVDHARAPRGPLERAAQAGGAQSQQPTTGGQNGINTETPNPSSPGQTQQSEPGAPAMPDESVPFEPEQPSGPAGGPIGQGGVDLAANPHEAYRRRAELKKRLIDIRQALKAGEDADGSRAQELAGIEAELNQLDAGLLDWEKNDPAGQQHRKDTLRLKQSAAEGDIATHPEYGEVKITHAGRTSATISTLDDQPLGEAPYHALKGLRKPQPRTEYDDVMKAAADRHGIPAEFLKAVALQESGVRQFDKDGKPLRPGTSNALGIMQIIPKWHPEFDAERLANDAEYNIDAGAQFLGELIKKHDGDLHKAAQSYYGSKDAAENSKYADSVLSRMGGTHQEAGTNEKRAAQDFQRSRGERVDTESLGSSSDNGTTDHSQIAEAGNGEVAGEKEKPVRIPESGSEVAPQADALSGAVQPQSLEAQKTQGSGNGEVLQGGDRLADMANTTAEAVSDEMPARDDQASAGPAPNVFVATHELSDGTPVTPIEGNTYKDINGDEYQDDYAEPHQPVAQHIEGNDQHGSTMPANAVGGNDGGIFQTEPAQAPTGKVVDDSSTGSVERQTAIDAAAHEAALSPTNDLPEPTAAQKEAGNYKKGHIKLHGLDITIENPKKSKRSGTDSDGKPWSVDMAHHYGYIKRSTGADNEHIDVFVGDNHDSDKAYVVNQVDPKTGKFDEHKIMLGFENKTKAKVGYLKNYAKGWKGLGSITEIPVSELKAKIESGAIRKPIRNATTETHQGVDLVWNRGRKEPTTIRVPANINIDNLKEGDHVDVEIDTDSRGVFNKGVAPAGLLKTLLAEKQETESTKVTTHDQSTNQAAKAGAAEKAVRPNAHGVYDDESANNVNKTPSTLKGGNAMVRTLQLPSGKWISSHDYSINGKEYNSSPLTEHQTFDSEEAAAHDAARIIRKSAERTVSVQDGVTSQSHRKAAKDILNWLDQNYPSTKLINESTQTNNPIPAIQPNEQNANPDPAQPVAPAAQENLAGKAAQPVAKKKAIVNDSDDLLAAIAKLGGLSRDEAKAQGIDPASFSHRGSGIKRVFTKAGRSYDEMAELLRGYNFDAPMANDLVDKVSRSINQGEKFYNPAGSERAAELMAQERFSDEQARLALELEQRIDDEEIDESAIDFLLEQYDDNIDMGREMSAEEIEAFWGKIDEQADKTTGGRRTEVSQADEVLQGYTESDLAGRAGAEKQRLKQEESDRVKAEQKAKADRERDSVFDEMAGSAPKTEDVFGMTDPLEDINRKPEPSKNTVFTEDAAEKARAILKAKLGQLNSGIDPELMQAGITLAGYHIEKGARTFAAYSRAMLDDLGDMVKPYLKSWYMAVKYDPRATGFDGLDDAGTVEKFELKDLEKGNAPSTDANLEPDSGNAESEKRGNEPAVSDERQKTDRDARSASGRVKEEGERSGSDSRPAIDTALTGRKRGNKPVHSTERPALSSELAPGVDDSERGGNDSNAGIQAESAPSATVKAFAEQGNRKAAATTRKVVPSDPDNIVATLPMLNDGQKADVLFAENRLSGHKGVLFTNGTGTGKTFSGLGIAKRFHLQGKKNIIVVVPSINIADQWAKAADSFFGMNINLLENTREAGKGPVITTYANFGMNNALVSREWDLVIADEAHKLMQSENGDTTDALRTLRGITYHRNGFSPWFNAKHADVVQALKSARSNYEAFSKDDTMDQLYRAANAAYDKAKAKYNETRKAAEAEYDALSNAKDPKVVFLSATPFAYVKAIDYAEGYLFDYGEGKTRDHYNAGNNQDQFFMQHFGYRMRYNKLTRPDANVDTGIMERQFNTTLRRTGALSFRSLDVNFDYDRKFILVESAIGRRIDEAMEWIREQKYQLLADELKEKFDHLQRRYLLEAIKAQEAIPVIKQHLALGRKVLVFHDYKKGGAVNPFIFSSHGDNDLAGQIAAFNEKFGDLAKSFSALPSPINAFRAEFGDDVMIYNGDVSPKERIKLAGQFNDDTSGKNLILVQSASAKEGVSFHDTTGKHKRVLLNIGLPTQPTTAIQQEGRIYRVGQQSDALFRYLNTGTNWERWAFASTIAQRASTAENLAAGEGARALKDAFINAFEESDAYPAGHEDEGKGGKAADKAAASVLSEFDRAKSLYFGQHKKTARTKSAEGVDYYATPEPVGLKMVEIADIRPGDSVLEPSAGHGAIARWFRDDAKKTAVEPSGELGSRLALVFDGDIRREQFEDLNIINKYDAIVMNPPFGSGGKTAIEHLAKAAKHLRMNGRIVALIPEGPSADKRFDAWMESETAKDFYLAANIRLPSSTFERAGTGVKTRIVVIDKVSESDANKVQQQDRDYSNAENIKELFERIENLSIRPRNVQEHTEGAKPESWRDQVAKADAAAKQTEKAAQESGAIAESADRAKFELKGDKVLTDAPAVQVTTKKGKVLDGVFVPNEGMAKAVDQFTYQANGRGNGWFVRLRHIERPAAGVKKSTGATKTSSTVDDVKSWLPKRVKRLLDAGKLKVVQSVEDLPAYLQERGTALYHAAWHGTPHDFDRFSLEHIGKGEGAQAFGYGLYFADSKGIAEYYRKGLSARDFIDLARDSYDEYSTPSDAVDEMLASPNLSDAQKDLLIALQNDDWLGFDYPHQAISAALKHPDDYDLSDETKQALAKQGRLYQVELAPEQDEYLLWDKPLSEQSDKVKHLLEQALLDSELPNMAKNNPSGQQMYNSITIAKAGMGAETAKSASDYLHSLGIRGIKYLDGTSRSGERENYNYVIFSDEDVSITAKYSKLSGVEALYDGRHDQMYLVADMLNQDNLPSVLAHELLHRAEAVDPQLKAAINRFENQLDRSFKHAAAGRGSAIEKAAYRRVMDAKTPAADQAEEYRAYLVSEYSKRPDSLGGLVRKAIEDFIAAIRVALIRSGLDMGFIRSLTPADLAAMSRYGAKVASSNVKQTIENGKVGSNGISLSASAMKSVEANIRRGKAAMTKALLNKTTEHRAMFRTGMGWVDFVWGEEGKAADARGRRKGAKGLSHILEARQRKDGLTDAQAKRLLFDLVETIARGEEVRYYEHGNVKSATINDGKNEVILVKRPASNTWMVTGYEIKPDAASSAGDALAATHPESTLRRNGTGAGDNKIPDSDKSSSGIKFSRAQNENQSIDELLGDHAESSQHELKNRAKHYLDNIIHALDGIGPLKDLPNKDDYLVKRYLTLGKLAKVDEVSRGIYDAFKDAGEDQANVFEYLTNKYANPSIIKNEAIRASAVKTKKTIIDVGQKLVDRGLLDEETYDRNLGGYLPRLYLKHLLDDNIISALGTGKKPSNMGYLKSRKDIPPDVRRLILGEITNPGYLASKGYGIQMRDVALLDWLEQISENKDWVLQQSLVDWKGRKVTPLYLKAEAQRIRAQAIHYIEADKMEAIELANEMDEVADQSLQSEQASVAPKGFKKIPNTPRYGAMRGLIVRTEIYDDIVGATRVNTGDESIAEQVLGYGGLATQFTQLWKWSKVAANPPAQVRNFLSNGILLHLSGVPFHKVPSRVIQAIREIKSDGKHWQIARKYGITESTFSSQEMFRIDRELLDVEKRNKKGIGFADLKSIGGKIMDKTGDLYQFSEAIFKTAKIIDEMEKGASESQAALEAQKWMFDYSLVTPSMRYLRNAPIGVPFLTFYMKALPRMLEVAATRPWAFAPYMAVPFVLTALVAGMADVDDDEVEKLKLALPEWLQKRGHAYFIPAKDENGKWQAIDFGYFLPWTMWTELVHSLKDGEISDAIQTTGILGGPITSMISAIQTNIDPFTKKEIVDERDPTSKQIASIMGYLWNLSAPTWVTNNGFAGKLYDALNGAVDKQGDVKTTETQAALRLLGVNMYSVDPMKSRANNLRHMKFEIEDIKRRRTQLLKERNLSTDERAEISNEYSDLIKERSQQMSDYARASIVHPRLR